jgi:hypothetical protein
MNKPSDSTQASAPTRSAPASRAYLLLVLGAIVILAGLGILWATQASPASRCAGGDPCLLYFYADW